MTCDESKASEAHLLRAVRRESEVGKVPVIPRLPDKSKDLRDARPVEPQSEGSVPVRFLPTKDKALPRPQ